MSSRNKIQPFGKGRSAVNPAHANELVDAINPLLRMAIRTGEKPEVIYSDENVILVVPPGGGSGGEGNPVNVGRFRLRSIEANSLTCRTLDGSGEGTEDVLVWKPTLLRNSITSRSVQNDAGVFTTITYTYESNTVRRTATVGVAGYADQEQTVVPQYLARRVDDAVPPNVLYAGDEIWAIETEIGWVDLNIDARAWCAIHVPPP